jgi:hypothetical protein
MLAGGRTTVSPQTLKRDSGATGIYCLALCEIDLKISFLVGKQPKIRKFNEKKGTFI